MIRLCWLIIFVAFTASISHPSQAKDFGLGVVIGNPIGVAGNLYLHPRRSVDGVIALNFLDNHYYIHSTYLHHYRNTLVIDGLGIDGFWGLGARIRQANHEGDFLLGPRLSGGMLYNVRSAPVDIFGEIALVVNLIEKTGLEFNLGIGARYYF